MPLTEMFRKFLIQKKSKSVLADIVETESIFWTLRRMYSCIRCKMWKQWYIIEMAMELSNLEIHVQAYYKKFWVQIKPGYRYLYPNPSTHFLIIRIILWSTKRTWALWLRHPQYTTISILAVCCLFYLNLMYHYFWQYTQYIDVGFFGTCHLTCIFVGLL